MVVHLFDSAKRKYQTTYPNGKVLSQAFTARNQLSSVSYDAQLMANFQYDIGMRETTRGLGNGLTQTTSYRQDNLISQKSVGTITNYSYSYDANKRKTSEIDGTMSSLSQTFSYDFENRLTSWSSNGTTLNQSQSWSLSLEGAWNSNIVNGVTENRAFNQTYETLSSDANLMTHDHKGNLSTNKDGSVYTWDFSNQLSFSTSGTPSVNVSYAYDALGRRVSKTSNNTVTVFVNAGYQILSEFASVSNSPFTEMQSFVYATYIDDPIALINAIGKYYYHSNQQFSIGAITDSSGNLVERFGYNAYGKAITVLDSSLVNNEYFFTGRQLDAETGLFYFRARYYDASLGQFISRDPIGYVDGFNLYRGYFVPLGVDFSGLDYTFNPQPTPPPNFNEGNILTITTNHSVDQDVSSFRKLLESNSAGIGTVLLGATSVADVIKKVSDQNTRSKKCISTLNLSGHGINHAAGVLFASGNSFAFDGLTAADVTSLKNSLCKDAIINICSCGSNDPAERRSADNLAKLLGVKVYSCDGPVSFGCKCKGNWILSRP